MGKQVGFEFPRDESGQWDGFNDPGIEHFSGNPFEYLGREVTQNAIDATVTSPCRLVIKRIDVPKSSVPDLLKLKSVIELCSGAADKEGPKAEDFFKRAEGLLSNNKKISVLQFADFNTAGVPGPCANGTPFFALMKATGQSKKESGTASGSFGIGKFAPYTVSDLRTVFLSTAFNEKAGSKETVGSTSLYVQGKSILMSHDDAKGRHRGTGFWGVKRGCLPVENDTDGLPNWLIRPSTKKGYEIGTTLSILGFRPIKNWQKILGASIAESFFGAICRGRLEVEIDAGPTLDSSSLASFFEDESVISSIQEQDGGPEQFAYSAQYLRALTSTEAIVESHQNLHLGHCQLHILVGEHLPKRVAILRNGMLITDELGRLKRFGDFKEFVAVVECLSDEGNSLLRAMEPPAHDDFQHARLPPERQQAGRIGLADLAKWVRDMLKRHAQDPVADVTSLDELADFFGDEEDGASGSKSREEDPLGKLNIRARPLKRKYGSATGSVANAEGSGSSEESTGDGDDEAVGGEGESGTGGTGGGGSNDGSGGTDTDGGGAGGGTKATSSMALKNVRAIVLGEKARRIAFTPDAGGQLRIELEDSGADTNRLLRVASSSLGVIEDGRITQVPCTPGDRLVIDVGLELEFPGTVRIKANAV